MAKWLVLDEDARVHEVDLEDYEEWDDAAERVAALTFNPGEGPADLRLFRVRSPDGEESLRAVETEYEPVFSSTVLSKRELERYSKRLPQWPEGKT